MINLFLNRRHIQDRTLTFAVTEAYRNRLMVGRYPVAVVMIEIDPALVDVNVHPAKAEVRFQDERAVFRAVQKAIVTTLNEHSPAPEMRVDSGTWSVPGWAERRQAILAAGQGSATSSWTWAGSRPGLPGSSRRSTTGRSIRSSLTSLWPLRAQPLIGVDGALPTQPATPAARR